jgi:hypothetical protein
MGGGRGGHPFILGNLKSESNRDWRAKVFADNVQQERRRVNGLVKGNVVQLLLICLEYLHTTAAPVFFHTLACNSHHATQAAQTRECNRTHTLARRNLKTAPSLQHSSALSRRGH